MQNQLQIFEHQDFGQVRVIEISGLPWFAGKDVAEILGYSNTKDAIRSHVDAEDKQILLRSRFTTLDIPNRGLTVINESGLYSLILSSKLPQAKAFKRWVTSEVLPCIRKHGAYATDETLDKLVSNPDFADALLDALLKERKKNLALEDRIDELAPKARYCDRVLLSGEALQVSIPNNIELLFIPPYTPEMNPIEQIWDEIREKHFANKLFDSLNRVIEQLCIAVNTLSKPTVQSIIFRKWLCEQLI